MEDVVGVYKKRLEPVSAIGRLLGVWRKLEVALPLLERCRPVELRGESLVIDCEDAIVAEELRMMGAAVVDVVKEVVPELGGEQLQVKARVRRE
jgi:predicted nucleic acid-binding Zn ribbon protein